MRLNPFKSAPDVIAALTALDRVAKSPRLAPRLLELVDIRASQLNGCAFCIDLHVKRALDAGEDPQRLHLLAAWRHAPGFSAEERAALAWTEALTSGAEAAVPDDVYETALQAFGEDGLVRLTMAINVISAWNRLAATFQVSPPLGMAARVVPPSERARS